MRWESIPDQHDPAVLLADARRPETRSTSHRCRHQDAVGTRGGRRSHPARRPGHRRSTAASTRSGGVALASDLGVPRSPAPMAAATPLTRPQRGSVRSGALPFFQLWPALLDPLLNGGLVAFFGSSRWPLPGPVQLVVQQIPNMTWVVRHARDVLDDLSHPRYRPHIRRVPVGFGAVDERVSDLGDLSNRQLGLAPGGTSAPQGLASTLPPGLAPLRDDLMGDADPTRNLGWDHAAVKQVGRLHPTLLHGVVITQAARAPIDRPSVLLLLLYRN